jgi:hypothetical protein
MTPRRALWLLIVLSTGLRLIWAASLGPGNDEAYHYLFTLHRDWSYFDHPPMLAAIEAVGIAVSGGVVSTLSLRLGFVALFAGSTWLMARLTSRYFGDRAGVLAAFGLNVTAYHSAAAGVFALPDGPLLFFWLLTLERLAAAFSDGRTRSWLGVGLAWGAAMLSKYHAAFLPVGALLYLAVEPSARRCLRSPGPYLASAVGLLVFSPVIFWNASHHWASFLFQGARAVGGGFRVDTLLAAIISPAIYLFPWIWSRLLMILASRGRRILQAETPTADKFLVCQAVVPLGTFLVVACTRAVLPHWTLVGFLPLFPFMGEAWKQLIDTDAARFRLRFVFLATMPLLVGAIMLFEARTGFFQTGRPGGIGLVQVARDPTVDMVGWDEVVSQLQRRGLVDKDHSFLFTSSWYHSGQLGFALKHAGADAPVLCYHAWDARSFAFWSKPEEWVGRDGILVSANDRPTEPECFERWFTRIEPLGEFPVERSGATVRTIRLFRCVRQVEPFPFDDLGRNIRPNGHTTEPKVASDVRDRDRDRGHESGRIR